MTTLLTTLSAANEINWTTITYIRTGKVQFQNVLFLFSVLPFKVHVYAHTRDQKRITSLCNDCAMTSNKALTGQRNMGRVKRIWYLSPMRAAKVQASLRIRAVSPEPPLLAHTSSESRGTFSQKARSQAPLNGWACAVKMCHDGMLEDTNSLDAAQMIRMISVQCKRSLNNEFELQ